MRALSLAFGKDAPFWSSCFNTAKYSGGSLNKTFAMLFSVEISFASIPNEIVSTKPNVSSNFTAPFAKFSALEIA